MVNIVIIICWSK